MLKRIFIFLLFFSFIFSVNVFATGTTVNSTDGSIFLEKLPGLGNLEGEVKKAFNSENQDMNKPLRMYLNWLIQTSVVLGSILAVGLIIAGGVEYMTTGTFTGKSEGKERVTNAVLGFVFLISGYLIFQQINPKILQINLSNAGRVEMEVELGELSIEAIKADVNTVELSGNGTNEILSELGSQSNSDCTITPGKNNGGRYIKYEFKNGGNYLKIGGHRNWRNNNPGNIVCTSGTRTKYNAPGCDNPSDDGVDKSWSGLVFCNMTDGYRAQMKLLLTKYANYTITALARKYQTGNPDQYVKNIIKYSGGVLKPNDIIGNLSAEKLKLFVAAQVKAEGMKAGKIENI